MFMGIVHQGEKVLQIPAERWVIVTVDQAGQQRFIVGECDDLGALRDSNRFFRSDIHDDVAID
jgi:hypothetical protein